MPKVLNNNEEKKVTKNNIELDFDKLKEENESLKNKIKEYEELMNDINSNSYSNTENKNTTSEEIDEPLPNKNIKIISLYYGSLNLSDGNGTKISFDKYGQIKNCLYGKLVDIVNNNLRFAQEGMFYIADKAAVYHLGLSDCYKKIQPKEILDNICDYDETSIRKICENLTDEQKDSLSFGISKRMFDGEKFDLNKIEIVSKIIDIDIKKRLENMIETNNNTRSI